MNCILSKVKIAWCLFRGLPSFFDTFAFRKFEELVKDINNINLNKLINKLISREARMRLNIDLNVNKTNFKNKNNKVLNCSYCNKKGYLESKYFFKYSELKSNKGFNKKQSNKSPNNSISSKQLIIINYKGLTNYIYKSKYKFILNSGVIEYYSPNKE